MYKPRGSERKGGGQSYIDIPYSAVSFEKWKKFFHGIVYEETKSGPLWRFKINSIGYSVSQELEIGQRRPQTFNIRGQKITSTETNRVKAWHPDTGFPQPEDPSKRQPIDNLVIYIVKTEEGEYWAGWFHNTSPCKAETCEKYMASMLDRRSNAGFLEIPKGMLYLDVDNAVEPFFLITDRSVSLISEKDRIIDTSKNGTKNLKPVEKQEYATHIPRSEEEILKSLFDEDENYSSKDVKERLVEAKKIRVRNQRAANIIKELYKGKCQISGEEFTFSKKDGTLYSEIHHLIPLGKGGADSPLNLIVVSPLIHRMLHYANVSGVDLTNIKDKRLAIKINGRDYTITWHPEHVRLIIESDKSSAE